ncbi:MAG: hypothetical protein FWH25_00615, partial [Syntrophorhabdaceae bacterium]|nr:hypothetical protein [Syntrophorhabdaceae bacterium]
MKLFLRCLAILTLASTGFYAYSDAASPESIIRGSLNQAQWGAAASFRSSPAMQGRTGQIPSTQPIYPQPQLPPAPSFGDPAASLMLPAQ